MVAPVLFFSIFHLTVRENCLLNSVYVFGKESQILEIRDNEWVQVLDNWDWAQGIDLIGYDFY